MPTSTTSWADITGAVVERWRVILGAAAVGLLAALAFAVLRPDANTSTSAVQVTPLGSLDTPLSTIDMETERLVAASQSVAARVALRLKDGSTPSQLQDQISVGAPSGSQILEFTAEDDDPVRSAQLANLFANAYLDQRRSTLTTEQPVGSEDITRRIEELEERRTNDAGGEIPAIDQQIAVLESQRRALADPGTAGGRVVGLAVPPVAGGSALPIATLVAGFALALLVGAMLALFADRRDPSVRNVRRLARAVDGSVTQIDKPDHLLEAARALVGAAGRTRADDGTNPLRIAILATEAETAVDLAGVVRVAHAELARRAGPGTTPDLLDVVEASQLRSAALQCAAARACHAAVVLTQPASNMSRATALNAGLVAEGIPTIAWWLRMHPSTAPVDVRQDATNSSIPTKRPLSRFEEAAGMPQRPS